jgi:hypothetical protein
MKHYIETKIDNYGDTYHYLNGKIHKKDGPAIICKDGTMKWLLYGKLHREKEPAVVWKKGTKSWLKNNKFHNEKGPAIVYNDFICVWYLEHVVQNIKFSPKTLKPQIFQYNINEKLR